jgi:hypothetical protein
MARPSAALLAAVLAATTLPTAFAANAPDIELTLERALPLEPGDVPEAAPATFVLLTGGQFYTGGSSEILAGRLTGQAHKALRDQIARVKKLKGLGASVELGPGSEQYRLVIEKEREIRVTGDPSRAPFGLRPLAMLLDTLTHLDDPSIHRYTPERFRLIVRQGALTGGCRPWTFSIPLVDALPAHRVVPALMAAGWPTGLHPASVCASDKTYVVALRPLLPWEGTER